jgi:hypothetical protein
MMGCAAFREFRDLLGRSGIKLHRDTIVCVHGRKIKRGVL